MEFSVCNNWRRQTRSISIKQPNSMKRVYRSRVSKSADAASLVFSITRPPTNKIKFKGQLALDTVACRPIGCQFAVSEITRDNTEVERPDHRLWTWLSRAAMALATPRVTDHSPLSCLSYCFFLRRRNGRISCTTGKRRTSWTRSDIATDCVWSM